jgi:hypothetical protein
MTTEHMRGNAVKSRIFSWNRLFLSQNKGLSVPPGRLRGRGRRCHLIRIQEINYGFPELRTGNFTRTGHLPGQIVGHNPGLNGL